MDQEQIVDALRDWLDGDDWHYEYDAERHVIRAGISLDCKLRNARIFMPIREDGSYIVNIVSPINGAELECTDTKMVRITLPAPNLSVIDGYICQNDSPKGTMYATKDKKWKYLTIGIRSRLYLVNETGDDYLLVFDGELFNNDQTGGAR